MPGDSWVLVEPPVTAIEGWNTFKFIDPLTATGSGIVLEEGSVWIGVKGATPGDYPAWLSADTDGYSGMATMQIPGGGWTSIAGYLRCNPMIRGYFDTDIDLTATEEIVPAEYVLAQNYPNPFNPVTTIHFELIQPGMTTIDIFDITGRHVRTLANSEMATGAYDLRFDASALSSGVYFYRLTSGSFTDIKKMSLVK
jgi:Secretion system C-terminal sorting domain